MAGYSKEEREQMLAGMSRISALFYSQATQLGCHGFIEFCGLMNEFIKVCGAAHERGEQFPFANTHSGTVLPFEPYNFAYLAEKLDCIYGPALEDDANRDTFIAAMFPGYELVERVPHGALPPHPRSSR